MRYHDKTFSFFASDVSTYLSCRHATQLHKQYAIEGKRPPQNNDPVLEVLKTRGAEHEKAYVEHLKQQALRCTDSEKKSLEQTLVAMASGVDVIVQAQLVQNEWAGFPDILLRVPGKSKFGSWQYEVQDTKLSLNTRTSTIIQLCFYTELLANLQAVEPTRFSVVTPGSPFNTEHYTYSDFKAYYAVIKRNFKNAVDTSAPTYPDPVEHCNICNWWHHCNDQRRKDDHLSFVAGLRNTQIQELSKQNITRLESFALVEKIGRPERGSYENLLNKKSQAKIQFDGRVQKALLHKALPLEEKRGFQRLPEPSQGDIYFDIEGDAFFPGGSLEYLFGIAFYENNEIQYKEFWATTRAEEKKAFMQVMSFMLERMKTYPALSIYHFAPYEPSTIKRLAHNYAAYEQELDDLLRRGKFVDLHAIVKEAIIASVERYSLKDIEKLAGYTRLADLRDAGIARKQLERALQLNEFNSFPSQQIETVKVYNMDDCFATEALHRWLERERQKLISNGESILRPVFSADPPNEKLLELEKRSKLLFELLTNGLAADISTWNDEQQAKWLLANQLQYFRRENKSAWWEHFRLQKGEYDDLFEDKNAIVGLAFKEVVSEKNLPVHRYSFPEQETTLKEDDVVFAVNSYSEENPIGVQCGTIVKIDTIHNTVDIKKTKKSIELHPNAIHEYDIINIEKLWTSILAIAVEVEENGARRIGDFRASKDLLMRRKPQLSNKTEGATILPGEDVKDAAIRIALNLNRSILPIQGPPGTGKTYTGAHIIISLINAKKKVGVTAVSHRVITTLFETVYKEAAKLDVAINFAHKVTDTLEIPEWINQFKDSRKIQNAVESFCVVGGTAWLWADDDFRDKLDYLIVDEAGQMALSQVLAASRAAQNLILLGDPQQLEQPQRGAHPEGSGVAALTHLLENNAVMPKEKGLFLNVTRRIHPEITKFTSQIFYNGQLGALPELENQKVSGTKFDGAGLFYVPVHHSANQNRSDEEIEKISEVVNELLDNGSWSDADKSTKRITDRDILIVAPYNAQVDALKEKLPHIDIGTVDKFQGREAPVVIYSMTASTVEDAPRGLNFLFSPNRLNVATSRAKCICILVASPKLFEAECNTIEQMRWANALCYYRELSMEVS
jgi:predicted RecB family nuclease